jgi:hypothetical protein
MGNSSPQFAAPVEVDINDVDQWNPTVAGIRDSLFAHGLSGGMVPFGHTIPERARQSFPLPREIQQATEIATEAMRLGRVIDFGMIPNEIMMTTAKRAGPMYLRGMIGQPFRDPWLFVHSWEQGVACYLIHPLEPDRHAGSFEAMEIAPAIVRGYRLLTIGDRAILEPDEAVPADFDPEWSKYPSRVCPSPWRFMPGMEDANNGGSAEAAAAGNVLDPLMTALMILSTNGVQRETVRASDKLQRARAKNGKPPVPSYDRVDVLPYVTAIMAKRPGERAEPKGGHHASPIPHLRRGHVRTYASGSKTFIRDSLVNFTDEAKDTFRRSHYVA